LVAVRQFVRQPADLGCAQPAAVETAETGRSTSGAWLYRGDTYRRTSSTRFLV
jgi:hypothetical protein